MSTRYGGRLALPLTLLGLSLSACSADEPVSFTSSPSSSASASPSPVTTPSPAPAATRTASPAARLSPSPTRSPAASPSPTRSRRPSASPKPSPTPSPTRKGVTYAISATNQDTFDPSDLVLRVGDTVRVRNDDTAVHDFVIDALDVDSGRLDAGDTFAYRFTKAGAYDFICSYHDQIGMVGTVTVRR